MRPSPPRWINVLLADESTDNLDPETAGEVFGLLVKGSIGYDILRDALRAPQDEVMILHQLRLEFGKPHPEEAQRAVSKDPHFLVDKQ